MKKLSIILSILLIIVVVVYIFFWKFSDKENKVHHFTSKDGVKGEYLIYPTEKSKGVLVWLHGDGAYEFNHPNSQEYLAGEDGIKQVAKEKNLTLIVPETVSNDDTWWKNGEENTDYLVELISSIPKHENLWIGSFSGGSETTTTWLLDRLPEMNVETGGAVLFGGGGSPKKEGITQSLKKNEHVKGSFPLTWIVGEEDKIKNIGDPYVAFYTSEDGEAFFASQGWDTKRYVISGFGHLLSKDGIGQYGKYLREHIKTE